MATDAQTLIEQINLFATQLRQQVETGIAQVRSNMILPFQTWVDFSSPATFEPNLGERIQGADLPQFQPPTTAPVALTETDISKFVNRQYVSPFLDQLQGIVLDAIEGGGTGIDERVQNALFENMREHDLQVLDDGLLRVRFANARKGFPIKTGADRWQENDLIKKHQDIAFNRNRETVVTVGTWARETFLDMMKTGLSVEEIHANFNKDFAALFLAVGERNLALYRVDTENALRTYERETQIILAEIQVGVENARLQQGYQLQQIEVWRAGLQTSTDRTQALIQQAEMNAGQRNSLALAYSNYFKDLVSSANTSITGIALKKG